MYQDCLEKPSELVLYNENNGVGFALIRYVQKVVPSLTPEGGLRLELDEDLGEEDQLAVACLLATGLKYIWETRAEKKTIILYKMKAEIEARISLLRRTRYWKSGDRMLEMIM